MKVTKFLRAYLKGSDVKKPTLVTISAITSEEMGKDKTEKLVLYCTEYEQGIPLSKTSIKVLAKLFGDETDDWTEKKVVMFFDPTVEFGGEEVGGIRFRAPKGNTAVSTPEPEPDEDLPF